MQGRKVRQINSLVISSAKPLHCFHEFFRESNVVTKKKLQKSWRTSFSVTKNFSFSTPWSAFYKTDMLTKFSWNLSNNFTKNSPTIFTFKVCAVQCNSSIKFYENFFRRCLFCTFSFLVFAWQTFVWCTYIAVLYSLFRLCIMY